MIPKSLNSYAAGLIKKSGVPYEEVIRRARLWAVQGIGSWRDLRNEDDVARLDDEILLLGLQRHYDGGLKSFLRNIKSDRTTAPSQHLITWLRSLVFALKKKCLG